MSRRGLMYGVFGLLLLAQCAVGAYGMASYWQPGHFGFNGAAYHQAARNSLRFGLLLPAQYHRGNRPPKPKGLYARAPLALHAHTVASLWLFGDRELSVRLVPAVNGVLALGALLVVVGHFWGAGTAALAGAIFLLLPINLIYSNMTNHFTGFFFWAMIALGCHLRWLRTVPATTAGPAAAPGASGVTSEGSRGGARWLTLFFCASFMALQWDWAAYYVMLVIALHWLYSSFDPAHRLLPRRWFFNREHAALALFCVMTLASFVGFLLLVKHEAGGFRGITSGIALRTGEISHPYLKLWTRSIEPMFTLPLLVLGLLWVVGLPVRLARRTAGRRELIAFAFLAAGTVHTVVFIRSAHIHSYWPWPLGPFLAIAAADLLLDTARVAGRLLAAAWAGLGRGRPGKWARPALGAVSLVAVLAAFFVAYLDQALPTAEKGRRCGGVLDRKTCPSGDDLLFFAARVKEETTRQTGVVFLSTTSWRIQFNTTLDRETLIGRNVPVPKIKPGSLREGWVLTGKVPRSARKPFLQGVSCYRYRQYGSYYLLDRRKPGPDIQIYDLEPRAPGWIWRFFVNARVPPLEAVRNRKQEIKLLRKLSKCEPES